MKGYWDTDFYQIEEENGRKLVHIMGYFYHADDGSKKPYRCLEYTWFYVPLEEFIEWDGDDYDDTAQELKQYIKDMTEEEAIDAMYHYFGGISPTPLLYQDLTTDTPCGYYVNARPEIEQIKPEFDKRELKLLSDSVLKSIEEVSKANEVVAGYGGYQSGVINLINELKELNSKICRCLDNKN